VTRLRGRNLVDGQPLASVPPNQVASTLGFRWFDRKLTTAVRWTAVAAKTAADIPTANLDGDTTPDPVFQPTSSYNLVNIYIGYEPAPDVLATFSVDNILDEYYIHYTDALPNLSAFGQNIRGTAIPSPGITYKAGLQVRFSAM
jgi:hemoglobin/transferrin/lactoferrin receptor protein